MSRTSVLIVTGFLFSVSVLSLFSQHPQAKKPHRHDPIEIDGTPVISRFPITLESPRRLLFDSRGNLFIVDSGLNKIFKMRSDRTVKTLAEDLAEPSGLALDADGNIYVANHADGEEGKGSVIRISANGKQSTFAEELTGPKGIAFDKKGYLYVALFDENRILRFDKTGKESIFAADIDSPAGLVFDKKGNLFVACSLSGTVKKIAPDGKATEITSGLEIPSDIAIGPDGGMIVTCYQGGELVHIDAKGKSSVYLNVPQGTIGVAFDKEGNPLLANWELSLLLKITSRFSVPCPHCKKKIPVRLKSNQKKKSIRKSA